MKRALREYAGRFQMVYKKLCIGIIVLISSLH